jgi:hypothetical protein
MAWINVDIDLDNVYDEMGRHEKELMVEWLREDGYISAFNTADVESDDASPLDAEWNQMIQKIHEARYRLTPEQEAMLANLAKAL